MTVREADEKLVRIPIGLPADIHEWLRTEAFRRRVPMAQMVREAISEYRDRREPQLALPFDRREPSR